MMALFVTFLAGLLSGIGLVIWFLVGLDPGSIPRSKKYSEEGQWRQL